VNPSDLLKLRWLRNEAINDLQSEEYDLIVEFTTRYQKEDAPTFTEDERHALDLVYQRVRDMQVNSLESPVSGMNVP